MPGGLQCSTHWFPPPVTTRRNMTMAVEHDLKQQINVCIKPKQRHQAFFHLFKNRPGFLSTRISFHCHFFHQAFFPALIVGRGRYRISERVGAWLVRGIDILLVDISEQAILYQFPN